MMSGLCSPKTILLILAFWLKSRKLDGAADKETERTGREWREVVSMLSGYSVVSGKRKAEICSMHIQKHKYKHKGSKPQKTNLNRHECKKKEKKKYYSHSQCKCTVCTFLCFSPYFPTHWKFLLRYIVHVFSLSLFLLMTQINYSEICNKNVIVLQ